jgi:hypothetical protein
LPDLLVPLYAFVRRKGHGPHDAQDLTQAFFARLLEKNYVAQADRERGQDDHLLDNPAAAYPNIINFQSK